MEESEFYSSENPPHLQEPLRGDYLPSQCLTQGRATVCVGLGLLETPVSHPAARGPMLIKRKGHISIEGLYAFAEENKTRQSQEQSNPESFKNNILAVRTTDCGLTPLWQEQRVGQNVISSLDKGPEL